MARKKFDLSLLPPAPNLDFEQPLWDSEIAYIAGIDEAGRGALAGPVAAAAVILPQRPDLMEVLHAVDDSKKMRAAAREHWAVEIKTIALAAHVGFASAAEVDELGIAPATRLAAMRALSKLKPQPQHLLIDYISLPGTGLPATSLVKGDARSLSIACASVLAKVARDAQMVALDQQYPAYQFAQNKGYGTAAHRQAIINLGRCAAHRNSFMLRAEREAMQARLF